MKNILSFLFIFIFATGFARAAEDNHHGFYFDLGAGGSFYANQNSIPYDVLLNLGYDFSPNWAAQVEWTHLGSNTQTAEVRQARLIPEVKLSANGGPLKPYALAGVGIESDTVVVSTARTQDYADLTVGGGIQFTIEEAIHLFLEAKLNYLLTSGSEGTFPLEAGIHFDL